MQAGAEYNPGPYTYMITKKYIVRQHLDKLRHIFQESQTEIKESLWLLVNLGVTVNRIQDETGASRSTIYRYIKRAEHAIEAERWVSKWDTLLIADFSP